MKKDIEYEIHQIYFDVKKSQEKTDKFSSGLNKVAEVPTVPCINGK